MNKLFVFILWLISIFIIFYSGVYCYYLTTITNNYFLNMLWMIPFIIGITINSYIIKIRYLNKLTENNLKWKQKK